MPSTLAIATSRSANAKVGACAVTYAAQQSCPTDCVFRDGGGCYAENGQLYTAVTARLNAASDAADASALEVARAEAEAIDAMEVVPGRPLRLHTVGDCATDAAARVVASAAVRYMECGGGPVWTYTHAWRTVERESWGRVSVLASCETPEDCAAARDRGYAPALVVADFPSRKLYRIEGADADSERLGPDGRRPSPLDVLPCPAQTTEDVTCADCRLCMDDRALLERDYAIGFAVHGTALTVKKALMSLDDPANTARKLTSRDHAEAFRAEFSRWPTMTELSKLAGVSKGSAWQMLGKLTGERRPVRPAQQRRVELTGRLLEHLASGEWVWLGDAAFALTGRADGRVLKGAYDVLSADGLIEKRTPSSGYVQVRLTPA